jgi:hypothetical protein
LYRNSIFLGDFMKKTGTTGTFGTQAWSLFLFILNEL